MHQYSTPPDSEQSRNGPYIARRPFRMSLSRAFAALAFSGVFCSLLLAQDGPPALISQDDATAPPALLAQNAPPDSAPPAQPTTPPPAPDNGPPKTAAHGPSSPQWVGLTVKEKLSYDWSHLFDPENIVFAGVGASFDQLRNRPSEWGQGWGPFGERFGSHIGYYVIQRSIMFPVQAIDHEDTRYFPSTHKSIPARIGDAVLHTVWRHADDGGMMPAFSEIMGDYGAAAVSRMWWPDHYHTASSILIAGSDTILVDAGINIFREFKPDIKRWMHLSR